MSEPTAVPPRTPDPSLWPPVPRQKLLELARDFRAGHVFTDRHLRSLDDLTMVFMPLIFADQSLLDRLAQEPPGMFYEHLSQAGPRSVNGYPCFFSVKALSIDDTSALMAMIKTLESAEKMAMEVIETSGPESDGFPAAQPKAPES